LLIAGGYSNGNYLVDALVLSIEGKATRTVIERNNMKFDCSDMAAMSMHGEVVALGCDHKTKLHALCFSIHAGSLRSFKCLD